MDEGSWEDPENAFGLDGGDTIEDAVCWADGMDHLEHEWSPGDVECRRCGADLSEWNHDE